MSVAERRNENDRLTVVATRHFGWNYIVTGRGHNGDD